MQQILTRFLLSLDQAVDTIFEAVRHANRGETYIPRVPSAKVTDIAKALIGNKPIKTIITGIRPGEKVHEILVSEEEGNRTRTRGNKYHIILPILPEISENIEKGEILGREFSSADNLMSFEKLFETLENFNLLGDNVGKENGELLR